MRMEVTGLSETLVSIYETSNEWALVQTGWRKVSCRHLYLECVGIEFRSDQRL
jgi:hypothetical protein